MIRRAHPGATVSTRRLEAFTDGVFSIAATLLVLDLTTAELGHPTTGAALWDAVAELGDQFLGFTVSFLLLCLLWMVHVRQFEQIVRVDTTTQWINSLRLLGVVLIPFSTTIAAAFPDLVVARLFMPVNFLWVIALGYLQGVWASRPGAELTEGVSPADARAGRQAGFAALLLAVAALALSPLLGSWAFAVFALDPLIARMLRRSTHAGTGAEGEA